MGSHSKHIGSLFRGSSQHNCENSTLLFAHHQAPRCFSGDLLFKLWALSHHGCTDTVCLKCARAASGCAQICMCRLFVQTGSEPLLKGSLRASLKNAVNTSTGINWMSNFNKVSHPSSSSREKGCWKKSRRGPVCQSLAVFLLVIANSLIKYFLPLCMSLFT